MRSVLLWFTAAALVFSCRPGASRDELVIAGRGLPLCLTPHLKSEVISVSVQGNMFEALVEFDPQMKIRPLLAQAWENPDDLTWVFRLRPGVLFHDGSAMDADDAVYSLLRAKSDPASDLKGNFVAVDTIFKADDRTVVVRTRRPYPILLNKLIGAYVIPAGYHRKYGDAGFEMAPVGTGPYRLQSFDRKRSVRMTRWDGYWGPKPDFRQVAFTVFGRPGDIGRLLQSGAADIVNEVPPETARELIDNPARGYRLELRPGLALRYLGINTTIRPFSDRRVRQAVSLAIDRQTLIQQNVLGFGSPATQLVPQAIFGYHPGLPELRHDPARARALLRAAGYGQGLKLALLLPDTRLSFGRELKRQMAGVGIELELNVREREEYFVAQDTSSFFLLGSISISGDASDLFDDVIHSTKDGYGRDNRGRYRNPGADRMIVASSGYLDQAQRLRALQEIMRLVMADLPRIPLYVEDEIYAVSEKVSWQPRLDMLIFAKEVNKR
jgi:peptide/nickel transport system substrate-binding protein